MQHIEPPLESREPVAEVSASDGLITCLNLIQQGTWRFVQLRGDPIGPHCLDGDDLDFIGSLESIRGLIDAAIGWMREGRCHVGISSRKPDKVALTLYSMDGKHCVHFDLWIQVPQLDRGRQEFQYRDLEPHVKQIDTAIQRLPADLEACLYVQHLVCKRKDLGSQQVQERLAAYRQQCHSIGKIEWAELLDQIRTTRSISREAEARTLQNAAAALNPRAVHSSVFAWLSRLRQIWLSPPSKPRFISIMGCDGAGKTTLAGELSKRAPTTYRVLTGKHLYRKSLGYKLAVIFLRPLITRSRERFDEILAPVVYLRACLDLRIRLWFSPRRVTLIDRSLVDFLYVNRKTDRPRFHRGCWLLQWFGCRIPTIHCHVSFDNIARRKQEMTIRGHATYDHDMTQHFTFGTPTEYVAFNNDGELSESVGALRRILNNRFQKKTETVPICSETLPNMRAEDDSTQASDPLEKKAAA
jgi:hypothetical protein